MWAYIGSPVLCSSPALSASVPEVHVELRLRHRSQVICVARTCHFNVYRTALVAELQPLLRSYLRKTEMTRLSDAFEGGLAHGSLWRLRLTSAVIMQHSDNEYSVIMQHQRRRRDPRLDGRTCAALGRRHTPRERRQPSLSARAPCTDTTRIRIRTRTRGCCIVIESMRSRRGDRGGRLRRPQLPQSLPPHAPCWSTGLSPSITKQAKWSRVVAVEARRSR